MMLTLSLAPYANDKLTVEVGMAEENCCFFIETTSTPTEACVLYMAVIFWTIFSGNLVSRVYCVFFPHFHTTFANYDVHIFVVLTGCLKISCDSSAVEVFFRLMLEFLTSSFFIRPIPPMNSRTHLKHHEIHGNVIGLQI